jgi:hypothetical protein
VALPRDHAPKLITGLPSCPFVGSSVRRGSNPIAQCLRPCAQKMTCLLIFPFVPLYRCFIPKSDERWVRDSSFCHQNLKRNKPGNTGTKFFRLIFPGQSFQETRTQEVPRNL